MKAIKNLNLSVCHLLLVLLPCGCSHEAAKETQADAEQSAAASEGVTFSAKHGLSVPPETAKFIGLEIVDVEERKVATELRFTVQVFRAAKEAQLASLQPTMPTTTHASGFISAANAGQIREGQSVKVTAEGTNTMSGRVTTLNKGMNKTGGQVEVLLAVTDEQRKLEKGEFLSVSAPLGGEKSVVSVPRSALFRTAEGDFVYTVSGEKFVRTPVKLGVVNHEFAEVSDGLFAGDQIAAKPVMTLWLAELQSIRGGKACADGH